MPATAYLDDASARLVLAGGAVLLLGGGVFFFAPWARARLGGVRLGLRRLLLMRLRASPAWEVAGAAARAPWVAEDPVRFFEDHAVLGGDPAALARGVCVARAAGVELDAAAAGAHRLAGGRLDRVVEALRRAREKGTPLAFDTACALDLFGQDPAEVVENSPPGTDLAALLAGRAPQAGADAPPPAGGAEA